MFRTPFNNDWRSAKKLKTTKPSLTVPNSVLSIPELLARYTRGVPVPQFEPQYADEFIPDIAHMDFVDADEIRRAGAENIERLRSELEAAKKAKDNQPIPASAASGPRSESKSTQTKFVNDDGTERSEQQARAAERSKKRSSVHESDMSEAEKH